MVISDYRGGGEPVSSQLGINKVCFCQKVLVIDGGNFLQLVAVVLVTVKLKLRKVSCLLWNLQNYE